MTMSPDAAMRDFRPALPLGVGLSAGLDSTALLVACAAKWPGQVVALHVNHHLQSASQTFEQRCTELCAALGVELRVAHVDARHHSGQSPEDAARQARYAALLTLAQVQSGLGPVKSIALAQHADDQVETFLLALSRGAGLAGLSAMPAYWRAGGLDFHRPLLAVPRPALQTWLEQAQIGFVEDPSNADPAFTRNRIRLGITPALQAAFPHYRDTIARSARHCAQAQELLDDLARAELASVLRTADALPQIALLQKLTAPHQTNVLRYWLKTRFQVIPGAAQIDELVRQIAACTNRGKQIHIKAGPGFVVRQGLVLNWYNPGLLQHNN